ncbi:MAG: helix-turn-helix domain-containing protein [Armatimonadota bacterium]
MPNLAALIRQAERERDLLRGRTVTAYTAVSRHEVHLSPEQMRQLLDAVSALAHEVMTTAELARYLKISRKEVLRLANRGDVPGFRVGRLWRFKREEVDRALRESTLRRLHRNAGSRC